MIISKTPYRVSFFGGGTDYPHWFKKYGGKVISTSINKHVYITFRHLPNFFSHKYRIVWSIIEKKNNINSIKHKVLKNLLKSMKIDHGLEIHYDGDLPAMSGMGSSSSFVVGLINTIMEYNKVKTTAKELAKKAIRFEQVNLKEVVGSQDQIASSFGGFNKITFDRNGNFSVKNLNSQKTKKLNDRFILVYSSIRRNASSIASKYADQLSYSKKKYMDKIVEFSNLAEDYLLKEKYEDFGNLIGNTWQLKKKLNSCVTNRKIEELYDHCIESGATGGKLLGAGGGGFMLVYVPEKNKKKFDQKTKKLIKIPFKFSNKGSEIIYNSYKNDN